jgi:hypothetical protein
MSLCAAKFGARKRARAKRPLNTARGDQLTRNFLRCGAFERRRGDETWVLGRGSQQNEPRIGRFDGQGCTVRVFDWAWPIQAPHRREPRIGAIAGAKGLPGSAFAPLEYPCTRSLSNRMPVLASLSRQTPARYLANHPATRPQPSQMS